MKKITILIVGFIMMNVGYSQCPTVINTNNINVNNSTGICGAEVNYIAPYILDTCSSNFFEDFESGALGWLTGAFSTVENWAIQDFSGTGKMLNSNMMGVPHSGNYAFGGKEHSFIQSPIFSSIGGGVVSFDFFVNNEPAFHDKEMVQISFDGGVTWNQVIGDQLPNDANNIQTTSFNISSNDGTMNTLIRFIYNTVDACCGAQDGFFIDNVRFEKNIVIQQISGLGSGSIFPIGTTSEVYELTYNGTTDTVSFNVNVVSINNTSQSFSICYGESITVGINSYSTTGTYVDSLSTQNGCDSIVTTNLIVKGAIDTSLSISNNLIIANELNATYQWIDFNNANSILNGETNREFLASTNGIYAVIITKEGCAKTSSNADITTVGMDDEFYGQDLNLSVYPNPATNRIVVSTINISNQMVISLMDVTGKEIFKMNKIAANKTEIDLSTYASGVYFLRLFNDEKSEIVKVIKR
jgi:hypothetical protein